MNNGDTLDSTTLLPLALSGGDQATLGDYAGQWLVLYFYPKDSTPGCTTEGIDFNALLPKFRKAGAVVLGVSRDSVKSHDNFCTSRASISAGQRWRRSAVQRLRRDQDEEHVRQAGTWHRTQYLPDFPDSRIVQSWRKVKVAGHADAVLAELKASQSK